MPFTQEQVDALRQLGMTPEAFVEHQQATALLKALHDGKFVIGYCLEVPEANGQGVTVDEYRRNLEAAIELVMEDRAELSLAFT